jgi:hypothetical protein
MMARLLEPTPDTRKTKMNIIKTTKTYATAANATKALAKMVNLDSVRWMIAVAEDGRFAPVVVFDTKRPELVGLAHRSVTVVG